MQVQQPVSGAEYSVTYAPERTAHINRRVSYSVQPASFTTNVSGSYGTLPSGRHRSFIPAASAATHEAKRSDLLQAEGADLLAVQTRRMWKDIAGLISPPCVTRQITAEPAPRRMQTACARKGGGVTDVVQTLVSVRADNKHTIAAAPSVMEVSQLQARVPTKGIAQTRPKRKREFILRPIQEPAPIEVPMPGVDEAEKRWELPPGTASVCRILCYGDSLTAGYSCWDEATGKPVEEVGRLPAFTPYGAQLFKGLKSLGLPCSVVSCGLHGFTARQMLKDASLPMGLDAKLRQERPDLVLLMVGSNDIWLGGTRELFQQTCALHRKCHEHRALSVAFGPPYPDCGTWRQDAKEEVKEQLEEWVRTTPKVLAYLDPEDHVSRSTEQHLWEPGYVPLHLTPTGYKALGERLVPVVAPIVRRFRDASVAATHSHR
mmetsp:Transcript_52275/g.122386  ORF Transcript_52275/g.122386 Transcript_52275/m.122386 type:complete len:432 (-) Transcript_52275:96-1391(-)